MDFSNIKTDSGHYKYFSGGNWQCSKSGRKITVTSPIDNSVIGEVCSITTAEADEVIALAHQAQVAWAEVPLVKRADLVSRAAQLLVENADELGAILMREIAKPLKSSVDEIKRTAEIMEMTADEAKTVTGETIQGDTFPGGDKSKISFVIRVPLGVVLTISPFNYPINLAGSKIAPALVTGNSVVFKPPSSGMIACLYFTEILNQAGFPAGVINTITGSGKEIGDHLVIHPGINMIAFTGSSAVGKHIATIAGMVPMLMELGGKDAAIVLDDANLDNAAKQIVSGAFSYSGQRCTAVKRVLVMESIADRLVEKLLPLVNKLTVGVPQDNCDICALISTKAADYVQSLVDDAIFQGATVLVKGKRGGWASGPAEAAPGTAGSLMWPWLFDRVTENMKLAWEEPFGPVLPIIRVKSIDDAIRICNQSEYGLQACIFTENINQAFTLAAKLDVGTVQINAKTARGPDHFPFLGAKSSGIGVQGIKYSVEAMTRLKSTVVNIGK